jgi:predicted NUDIX family NTP pyrophosphohydrolase
MKKKSAGILLYRFKNKQPEFFLVHYGGPFWKNKDLGSWSIPKGEFTDDEKAFDAALREFKEETGIELQPVIVHELQAVKQKSGKIIYAWAIEGDINESSIFSNEFEMEWPPKSGKMKSFPEIDKGEWYEIEEARKKINPVQVNLLNETLEIIFK